MELNYRGTRPIQATEGSAGMDLIANFTDNIWKHHILAPGERTLIHTGTFVEIPKGYVGMVSPRSGLALRQGVTVLNAPGIIDSDYRGEIGVILINMGDKAVTIMHGERIAQLLIVATPVVILNEASLLTETARGDQGFGSTGK